MTIDQTPQAPPEMARHLDVTAELTTLQERVQTAETARANLERALDSNRRIGIAIGILMSQRRVTDDQAFSLLRTRSQHDHVKVRELAESVIYTGTV